MVERNEAEQPVFSTYIQTNLDLAMRDGNLGSLEQLSHMTDREINWNVRGNGRWQGLGPKSIAKIREVYPMQEG
ncbi:MAG: hypothetical protein AAB520_01110 [Patescibacteria group bacterium]